MVSKCFYFLLLCSVVWCDASKTHKKCSYKDPLPIELVCATQDVIWGWLNVVNQPALRAEAVKRNVSEVMQKAREVRGEADAAIAEYKKILVSLDSFRNRKEIEAIDQAIADVSKSIERANQSELKAENATKAAEDSIASSIGCFNDIMRVAFWLWKVKPDGEWSYAKVKATLDQHDKGCKEKYNVSVILNNTGNIDTMNLTEWKKTTLEVLKKTYDGIKSNECGYHWSVRDDEKIKEVKDAVEEAVDLLDVAVRNFELSRAAVNDAKKKLENASRKVEETNNSLLASANGKVFCEVVGHFWKSNEKLRATHGSVAVAKQHAVNSVIYIDRVQAEVMAAGNLVKKVMARLQGNYLVLVGKWSDTHTFKNAAHNVSKASGAVDASLRTSTKVNTSVNEIEKEMKTQGGMVKFVEAQLTNMSDAENSKMSNVTLEACSKSVTEILKSKSSKVIRRIAKFNTTLLVDLNATLHKIDGEADAIKQKLLGISEKVHEANSRVHSASLLGKQATENVKEAIVEVLSGVVAKLCAVLSDLRALHNEADAFSVHAAHAQANISDWLVRVDATAKESDGFADLTGSVEGAFATAGKRLEVLKRILYRADEQRGKVVGELAASVAVKESDEHGIQINKTLHNVFANITSRVSADFSKDACNASLMTQSLKLLSNMTDHTAVMNSLQVVAQLNRLTESMKERVLKAHNLMRMAAESSAQADAALEEAIRMARERSGKPQCPALYRQLLGALGLHW
ncbi:hypothetical protein ERJ75_000484100 [Trypanosoma vivax]|uniref:Uncharacterized protein n=1 Tax=Trypanosoma vivax (strain Y486) TaxID=1055687 RepID=F9WSI3_TRYVY|nr:hypothetical protein ERJ75_000484100 [Trypanosoma vivax]CCD20522.1 hypothetical protein, conserved in T. vivax [Trypanosoma vivax Y486]|eukprot:CCD20522.1 hypothetical protein, conserved in T. vivax [Trypanosoma vivax Y486]